MKYYFVEDNKSKRHIVVAENEESLQLILGKSKGIYKGHYELKADTFKDGGFLISDK